MANLVPSSSAHVEPPPAQGVPGLMGRRCDSARILPARRNAVLGWKRVLLWRLVSFVANSILLKSIDGGLVPGREQWPIEPGPVPCPYQRPACVRGFDTSGRPWHK